jgi:phosphatidylserine/phosphatidylglycerophosphate/cardiolipin synthase-like enzyme
VRAVRTTLACLTLLAACSAPTTMATGDAASGGDGRMPPMGDAGAPPQATSSVRVIVEPNGNHASELSSAINGAQQSVYMTMYQIDNSTMINALVGRKQAGLDVEVVLDGSSTNKSWNTPAYNTLHNAGVAVVWSNPNFTYTHEKTVIIDAKTAWIMTMNLNVSPPSSNREYLAIDTDPSDVAEATAVFKADHALQTITPSGKLVVANNNARPLLVAMIDSATRTLDLELEELSDLDLHGVVNAIARAGVRGVTVRIVLAAGTPTTTQMQAINELKPRGVHIVVTGPSSSGGSSTNPYIHAKAGVVDCVAGTCALGFVGSENFSGGSLGYNRELGVLIDNATELAKIEATINSDFGRGTPQ